MTELIAIGLLLHGPAYIWVRERLHSRGHWRNRLNRGRASA